MTTQNYMTATLGQSLGSVLCHSLHNHTELLRNKCKAFNYNPQIDFVEPRIEEIISAYSGCIDSWRITAKAAVLEKEQPTKQALAWIKDLTSTKATSDRELAVIAIRAFACDLVGKAVLQAASNLAKQPFIVGNRMDAIYRMAAKLIKPTCRVTDRLSHLYLSGVFNDQIFVGTGNSLPHSFLAQDDKKDAHQVIELTSRTLTRAIARIANRARVQVAGHTTHGCPENGAPLVNNINSGDAHPAVAPGVGAESPAPSVVIRVLDNLLPTSRTKMMSCPKIVCSCLPMKQLLSDWKLM